MRRVEITGSCGGGGERGGEFTPSIVSARHGLSQSVVRTALSETSSQHVRNISLMSLNLIKNGFIFKYYEEDEELLEATLVFSKMK